MRSLLKISDFACLCGSTKDTLLYYDRHDLLKPVFISQSGYRYYSIEQYYEFDYISVLKGAGYSLSLIKKLLHKDDTSQSAMREALASLKAHRDEIDAKINMLESLSSVASDYNGYGADRIFFKEYGVFKYGFIKTDHHTVASSKESVAFLSEYLKETKLSPPFIYQPVGTLIKKGMALRSEIVFKGFLSRAFLMTEALPKGYELKSRRAGFYACIFHKDNDEGHSKAIKEFINSLVSASYSIKTDIFAFYDAFYISHTDKSGYLMRYEVCVQ